VKAGNDQKPVAIWTGKNEFFVQAPQTDRQTDRQTNSQTVMYRSFPVVGSSLLPRGQRLVSPVGELKSITMEERPNRHKTPTAHHSPPAGPPIVPTIARN
jgi:hypothetical protein